MNRISSALVFCLLLGSSGCIRVARPVAYYVQKPPAPPPAVVYAEPAAPPVVSIDMSASVGPSASYATVDPTSPAVSLSSDLSDLRDRIDALHAQITASSDGSIARAALRTLDFEIATDASPPVIPGDPVIDAATGHRGHVTAMVLRARLADAATAADRAERARALPGGIVAVRDNVVVVVFISSDDVAVAQQLAELAVAS
jgi:hypothetical protein